ncbi:DUF4265 domain-containing protein [Krasilnikovia cinnamomea]|uniref:DUF4265 domain-containing protein n=1 Tax=Krasilnikovia cinnamomea TaxID=349313 RepID=UPI003BF8D2D8
MCRRGRHPADTEGGLLKLVRTPGLTLGVAAGGVIQVNTDDGSYGVISRGGNLAPQLYGPPDVAMSIEGELRRLGRWHDGCVKNMTILTVPVRARFDAIESTLNALAAKRGIEWYYGNVYGEDCTTPLNWWVS